MKWILPVTCSLLILAPGCGGGGKHKDGSTQHGMDGGESRSDGSRPPGPDGSQLGPDACVPTCYEICGDRIDQNCDGHDESCVLDGDGDGIPPCHTGQMPPACDCDDENPNAWPGAPEQCDGKDDDCDCRIDEAAACCAACTGMVQQADTCTPSGQCVCSTEGAGDAPCPAGQSCCTSGCVDAQTDFQNCGGCGRPCTSGTDRCTAGACMCGTSGPCVNNATCTNGMCSG